MDDPFESRLRSLMQESDDLQRREVDDDERLGRVLHRAHIRGGVFDLLGLFANWGLVIAQASGRGPNRMKQRTRSSTSRKSAGE